MDVLLYNNYNKNTKLLLKNDKCGICMNTINNIFDNYIVEICNHNFHIICYYRWFKINNICPICRIVDNNISTKIYINIQEINNNICIHKEELIRIKISYIKQMNIYNNEIEKNKLLLKEYIKSIKTTDNTILKINFNNIVYYVRLHEIYNNIFILEENYSNKKNDIQKIINSFDNKLKITNFQNELFVFCKLNKSNILSSNIIM